MKSFKYISRVDNKTQKGWYVRYTPAKFIRWFSDSVHGGREEAYLKSILALMEIKIQHPKIPYRLIADPPRRPNKLGIIGVYQDKHSAIASYYKDSKRTHKRFALNKYQEHYQAVEAACQFLIEQQPHRKKIIEKQLISYLCKQLFEDDVEASSIVNVIDKHTPCRRM